MQAVVFDQAESVSFKQVDDPRPLPGEVVVRVRRAGICGTDVHIFRNEYLSRFPLVPGHELVGDVVETTPGAGDLTVGDRVAVDPNLYCNRCYFCRNQQNNHCLNWQGVGITRSGAFAQYLAAPAAACYRVPDGINDTQAAMIEPLSCVVHAMTRLTIEPADEALVFGAGPIGLLLCQALATSGVSKLIVVEKSERRLRLARQMGFDAVAPDEHLRERLRPAAPHGFAIVADATGVPAVIERCFDYLKPRGRYLQFGVTPKDAAVRLKPFDWFKNDWTILGSFALCYTFQRAIDWLAAGRIDVAPLVSDTAPLAEFPKLFDDFANGRTLKVHLDPTA